MSDIAWHDLDNETRKYVKDCFENFKNVDPQKIPQDLARQIEDNSEGRQQPKLEDGRLGSYPADVYSAIPTS